MSHMVIFRSGEGKAGYHQAESLEEAARFVERLRNAEQVEQARIFRMEEVSFEYRPYFRVEVGGAGHPAAVTPDAVAEAPVGANSTNGAPAPVPVGDDHDAEEAAAGARRGLFSR